MIDLVSILHSSEFIDLSVPISPDHPCHWPGNNKMTVEKISWYDQNDPYYNRLITFEEHTGTHFDAPAHFIPDPDLGFPRSSPFGKITVEKVELRKLIVPAAVLNVTDLLGKADPGISPKVTVARLKDWERNNHEFQVGDGLLLYTGWSDTYYCAGNIGSMYADRPVLNKDVPAWPALEIDALEYLIKKGISLVGTDCPSGGSLDNIVECHYTALAKGLLFVENLINLSRLPAYGSLFFFLPLKIIAGSGAPGRAIAMVAKA